MKFNFKLEPVLKHRQMKEDIAKKEYAEAEQKVQQSLTIINGYYDQIEELRISKKMVAMFQPTWT